MNAEWVKSAAARRILVHWADPRPAWLWSADGTTLLWRNGAAPYFNAKLKKHGLKVAPSPVPIKGQVPRLIRLGSVGRSSLSRLQFLAGGRPAATTATVTPLELWDGTAVALVVGVDAIEPAVLAEPLGFADSKREALLPADADYLLLDPTGAARSGSNGALERFLRLAGTEGETAEFDGDHLTLTRLKASPQGHQLLLIEGASVKANDIAAVRAEEGAGGPKRFDPQPDEPLLPMGLPPVEASAPATDEIAVPEEPAGRPSLSSLFDQLADNPALYRELSAADEMFVPPPPVSADVPAANDVAPEELRRTEEPDVIAAVIAYEDDLTNDAPQAVTYRVVGRGFTPLQVPPEAFDEAQTEAEVERTSRYNFDELSRILSDRVSSELPPKDEPVEIDPPIEPIRPAPAPIPVAAVTEGALVNIAAETFILNRLPLGIMVFRDQQVLFANRALTDLVGYETVDSLRAAGLTAIFPSDEAAAAGPVTHLVRRDGAQMPVTARLQSITWQGRPALLLSANTAETRVGHEGAVRAFAELLAQVHEEGFVRLDRSGVVAQISSTARLALAQTADELVGLPLTALIRPDEGAALRDFLERPARFAETARPSISLGAATPGVDIILFAEGQAGVVTGYFGFVRHSGRPAPAPMPPPEPEAREDDLDPSMLARVTRGVRRPLNTIIGFADLIRSAAFGTIENHKYLEYARDIRTAGQEIAVLVDELDDYARLRTGKYAARPAELDLGALLESCVVRVRGQAGAARVLVRSAISERLPRIRADRASLGQAVLNLLASAIDQTPAGGTVILSAQFEDDNTIVVNVRDNGAANVDPGERFVVFRDGVGKDGETLAPVRSSVGLALTRALVAVNGCSLSVDPAGSVGTLFSLVIPADLVAQAAS